MIDVAAALHEGEKALGELRAEVKGLRSVVGGDRLDHLVGAVRQKLLAADLADALDALAQALDDQRRERALLPCWFRYAEVYFRSSRRSSSLALRYASSASATLPIIFRASPRPRKAGADFGSTSIALR